MTLRGHLRFGFEWLFRMLLLSLMAPLVGCDGPKVEFFIHDTYFVFAGPREIVLVALGIACAAVTALIVTRRR